MSGVIENEYLAVDYAVPVRYGLISKLKLPPDLRLEVVVEQPSREN